MAHCEYLDSNGVPWQVWDVTPKSAERRKVRAAGDPLRKPPERRKRKEVRMRAGVASEPWLVFESPHEKRRLQPVPDHWHLASAGELEAMCARASPAKRHTPRLVE